MITVGVDPGGRYVGICLINDVFTRQALIVQCDPASCVPLVQLFIRAYNPAAVTLAVEAWAMGPVSQTARAAGATTRRLIGELEGLASAGTVGRVHVQTRPAGLVKPWATDKRLEAAGLAARTVGLPHARDAARHALYSHVRDSGYPDPLRSTTPR